MTVQCEMINEGVYYMEDSVVFPFLDLKALKVLLGRSLWLPLNISSYERGLIIIK